MYLPTGYWPGIVQYLQVIESGFWQPWITLSNKFKNKTQTRGNNVFYISLVNKNYLNSLANGFMLSSNT